MGQGHQAHSLPQMQDMKINLQTDAEGRFYFLKSSAIWASKEGMLGSRGTPVPWVDSHVFQEMEVHMLI